MAELTHVSLFSGIGGIDLAAEWAGFHTVLHCEIDTFCVQILQKHWPEVPIHGDIHTLTSSAIRDYGVEAATVLSGGFPCQPFSVAGRRRGTADHRDLWPEMLRVISEVRPRWIIGENVANFVNMALDRTVTDLETKGYEVGPPLVFPAAAVGSDHTRNRVFVIAHDYSVGGERSGKGEILRKQRIPGWENVRRFTHVGTRRTIHAPHLCGAGDGIPRRVDRLRVLGNAVVPQQVYPILASIARYERLSYAQAEEAA